ILPMLAREPATTSAIVAALNPLVAKTSVAASRIRCWVAPVLAQRRACAEVAIPRRYRVCRPLPEFARLSAARRGVSWAVAVLESVGAEMVSIILRRGRCGLDAHGLGWSVRTRRTGSKHGGRCFRIRAGGPRWLSHTGSTCRAPVGT